MFQTASRRESAKKGANKGKRQWNNSTGDAARWVNSPVLDRDGRPVELLSNWQVEPSGAVMEAHYRTQREADLCAAVSAAGVNRPHLN
jgi:hypothetical protein